MRIISPSYSIEKLDDGEEILKQIERAGRTCYKSEDRITEKSAREFVKMIISRGHLSVIEHPSMTVRFICDRGFTHELVRHRLVSYSQESTRYCNYSKGKFGSEISIIKRCYWVSGLPPDKEKLHVFEVGCREAEARYLDLIELGAKPEEARAILPIGLKTEIVMSANLRQWGHTFYQRTSPKAHPQMRELMVPLLAEVQSRIPIIFDDVSIYN
jgi:thymidylate synthase (FAD)